MENKATPKIYLSTRLWRSYDYFSHKSFFDAILQKCQDDFNRNGYRQDSVLISTSKIIEQNIFELRQVTKEYGDFRLLWGYAKNYKYFNKELYNEHDVFIYEITRHKELNRDVQTLKGVQYAFQEFQKCPIVLDENQRKFIDDVSEIVIIEGNAGTGKTLICIDKLIDIWIKNRDINQDVKVLFLTYSNKLITQVREKIINNKYTSELQNLLRELEKPSSIITDFIKQKISFFNDLFFDLNDKTRLIEQIKSFLNFLENINYTSLDISNNGLERIVNFEIFKRDFFDNKNLGLITEALRNTYKIKNIDLRYYFDEIEGVILGFESDDYLSKNSYKSLRLDKVQEEFDLSNTQIDKYVNTLYQIFDKYREFLKRKYIDCEQGIFKLSSKDDLPQAVRYIDRNSKIKTLCENQKYDYAIVDEVQDLTQNELISIIKSSDKFLFAGDAMQMINPAHFSFKKLKDLYRTIKSGKSVDSAKNELINNYRSSNEIFQLSQKWYELNINQLGVHNFNHNNTKLINDKYSSNIYYIKDKSVIKRILKINQEKTLNTIFITERHKDNSEDNFYTVSEIKGCEEDNVVLYNLLSENYDKWQYISTHKINKADADENFIYRYYFNLFYVAFTRARNNVIIIEDEANEKGKIEDIELFKNSNFFKDFICLSKEISDESLEDLFEKITEDEVLIKIEEHIKNQNYKQALFFANKLSKTNQLKQIVVSRCNIYLEYVAVQRFNNACQKFLENNFYDDAANVYEQYLNRSDIAQLLRSVSNNSSEIEISQVAQIYYSEENEIIKKFAKELLDKNRSFILQKLQDSIQKLKEI